MSASTTPPTDAASSPPAVRTAIRHGLTNDDRTRGSARPVTSPSRTSSLSAPVATAPPHAPGRVRRARLHLRRIDPWSVMKIAFLLSLALFVVGVVAVFVLWTVLDAMGVFTAIGGTIEDVTGAGSTIDFDIVEFLALRRVLGFTLMVSAVNVVLLTALATLYAFLYNLAAGVVGGFEVTLSELE